MSRCLGIDYGSKRVGLALSDPLGITARPLDVVARASLNDRVAELVASEDVGTIVVGLPTGLSGEEGDSAVAARELGEELRELTGLPVVYVDERLTSRIAESSLLESGMKRRERRENVDKVAAAVILQSYLDQESS